MTECTVNVIVNMADGVGSSSKWLWRRRKVCDWGKGSAVKKYLPS